MIPDRKHCFQFPNINMLYWSSLSPSISQGNVENRYSSHMRSICDRSVAKQVGLDMACILIGRSLQVCCLTPVKTVSPTTNECQIAISPREHGDVQEATKPRF